MSVIPRTAYLAMSQRAQFLARAILLVMIAGWVAWFFPFDDLLDRSGTPLGADFSMFYVAGQVINSDSCERLYDQSEHQGRLGRLFAGINPNFCLPYRYPPFVAMLSAPLARLSYAPAYLCFLFASFATWMFAIWLLIKNVPSIGTTWRAPLTWSLAAWPVALETLIGGQASMFAALIAVGTLSLARSNRPMLAGAVMALALYKPNVLGLFAFGLLLRFPRMLLGGIPVAIMLSGLCYFAGGLERIREYIDLLTQLAGGPWDVETPSWKVHGLASWIGLVWPGHAKLIAMVAGLVASAVVSFRWRLRGGSDPAAFALSATALLIINVLFNPYTPIYDLVLIGPAVVFGAECLAQRSDLFAQRGSNAGLLQLILATLFFGPHLSQALAKTIGVQIFPVALVLVGVWFFFVAVTLRVPSSNGTRSVPATE